MALKAVGHVAGAMGAAAFDHHSPHGIVVQDSRRQTERRLKHMACGARRGSCGGKDKFSMRVLPGIRSYLRVSTPVFRMTGQTRLLLSNELLVESRRRRPGAPGEAACRVTLDAFGRHGATESFMTTQATRDIRMVLAQSTRSPKASRISPGPPRHPDEQDHRCDRDNGNHSARQGLIVHVG
jgi:hypothetical protein